MRSTILPLTVLVVILCCASSCADKIYVVRHAEKAAPVGAAMSSDVPLTAEGEERAQALLKVLRHKRIRAIHSTSYQRTMKTAQPTAEHFGITIQAYGPKPDSTFYMRVQLVAKNQLIVGHSNTVDDIVNHFAHAKLIPADLPETEFNNLFVLKRYGWKWKLKRLRYGK